MQRDVFLCDALSKWLRFEHYLGTQVILFAIIFVAKKFFELVGAAGSTVQDVTMRDFSILLDIQ